MSELADFFFRKLGVDVVRIQAQTCNAESGAAKWCKWHQPETIAVEKIVEQERNMWMANHYETNPVDWYIRILGTPPVFVLDDVDEEQIQRMGKDGVGPFATVETSPGNYQAWIRLKSDSNCLRPKEWHVIHGYLVEKYNADKGAAGENHAYRLPLPGAFSHKRKPYPLQINYPSRLYLKSPEEVLAGISDKDKERLLPMRLKNGAKNGKSGIRIERQPSNVPEWFREKWNRRRQEIIEKSSCPRKRDGTPDWSAVDYRVVWITLSAYRDRDEAKRSEIAEWLTEIIAKEGEKRGKRNPKDYAERTVKGAMDSVESNIKYYENEIER